MQVENTDSIPLFYPDKIRDTTVGRYLSQHEHAFINRFIEVAVQPRRLLDISCGSGRITLPLHELGLTVVGLDIDPIALAAFQRQSRAVPLLMSDAQCLPFPNNSFDCVVSIQCFEYLNHRWFLQECNRVLSDSGLLIFDFLNRHSYKWLLKKLSGRTLRLPSANLSCREVLDAITDYCFSIQAVSGYNWVPFTRESNSALVSVAALFEKILQIDRCYSISPKILVAARKWKSEGSR